MDGLWITPHQKRVIVNECGEGGETVLIRSENISVTINAHDGGRLSSLQMGGTELLVTSGPSPFGWGMFPMAPYAGRVRNGILTFMGERYELPRTAHPHAIHGTLTDIAWNVKEHTADAVQLVTELDQPWPFKGEVHQNITVSESVVRCELLVIAHEVMPVQVGWHPWFVSPESVHTDFGAMLERDAEGIATLHRIEPSDPPVDDCFVEPVSWPQLTIKNQRIEISSDCSHWVRYDSPLGHVCIEPQSGPPNGVNTEPLVLHENETTSRWMEIRSV